MEEVAVKNSRMAAKSAVNKTTASINITVKEQHRCKNNRGTTVRAAGKYKTPLEMLGCPSRLGRGGVAILRMTCRSCRSRGALARYTVPGLRITRTAVTRRVYSQLCLCVYSQIGRVPKA